MGIESDKLVFDYLSRVGDLAQTAMGSADRMRLVARLRGDIERQRGGSDSEAVVRRILGKLGTPDEVVQAAARQSPGSVRTQEPVVAAPAPSRSETVSLDKSPAADSAADEWWRMPPDAQRAEGGGIRGPSTNEVLAGWSGGLLPPEPDDEPAAPAEEVEPDTAEAAAPRRRFRFRLRRAAASGAGDAAARRRLPVGPLELLAALALVAGVVLGNWLALGAGWLLAYSTHGIARREAKFAALGVPGLVVLGEFGWLWGRTDGRWGAPLSADRLGQAITADFPVTVKVAALGTAAFLLWRSARR
ncbi:hypothetical protein ACFOSC_26880 [Streptantibioticus rubrisoli]|uniref:Integral membrane protein n=1 Tax=Streptantibioticus rubrisoli TaxID=1387313 RepID=A0ABT1PLQ5_9ACTN|nr:hypothetical protein [Streptantibioticus rubrisoli]MCQ4046282.1 hypothetical protein [Streptantibioticus rubrisoli]